MMYSVHVCLVAEEERWVVDGLFFFELPLECRWVYFIWLNKERSIGMIIHHPLIKLTILV